LDGLDIALCKLTGNGGETKVEIEQFTTTPFEESFKAEIRKIFAKREIDFQQLVLLNEVIGAFHGKLVREALQNWNIDPKDVDLVASHGQTVFHAPKKQHRLDNWPNGTLQIGDGDHLAKETGIITISDFRQKHVAHGGEGAPLAVYGDYFVFSKPGENRILLNMGGISNFTFLPGDLDTTRVFVTDTGPGNTLMDALARKHYNLPYDADAAIAKAGKVNQDLLAELKHDNFFDAPFPKTTGPEVFNLDYLTRAQERSKTTGLSNEDVMATLAIFTADTISDAIKRVMRPGEVYTAYASGGGMHNPVVMQALKERLPAVKTFGKTDDLGLNGDAKEAVLFAVLANECVGGKETAFGKREGVPSCTMGKISLPL